MDPTHGHESSPVVTYLRVLRRRWWVVLLAAVLTTAVVIVLSLQQQKLYKASAEVLINRENLADVLTGVNDTSRPADDDRLMQTQADLARVEVIARRTLRGAHVRDRTPAEFLNRASASPKGNTDILRLSVTDPDPELAMRLATAYARQFAAYRSALDTNKLARARREASTKLEELRLDKQENSALFRSLLANEQQLATLQTLQSARATPVQRARDASQVQPRVARNAVLGLVVGLIVGVGLAFLLEALDTRVRNAGEIEHRLGLPLLGRVPAPPRDLNRNQLAMQYAPSGGQAEAFRMLRTNLEFVMLDRNIRSILVTSAVESEGKSATAANLAVAMAGSGRRVVLADLDMRRSSLHELFSLDGAPGLTQVALGRLPLERALVPISIAPAQAGRAREPISGNGGTEQRGALRVLASGPSPPDPGEFVAGERLERLLKQLAEYGDLLIVDAPPLLRVGDAMTLSSRVDGILVVTRLKVVRRGMLTEMHRLLNAAPAAKLGFVMTDAAQEESHGYGYGYEYGYRHEVSRGGRPAGERSLERRE